MVKENDYHDECDVLNSEIIKKLVEVAQSEEVKDTILLYDVAKDGKQIKKDMTATDNKHLILTG